VASGVGVSLGGRGVLLGSRDALGDIVGEAVMERAVTNRPGVSVGWRVAVRLGVDLGALVLVGGLRVEVGAVVGWRVGEGPMVGTVWNGGAPQV
jgi:hypothetical protein